MPGVAYKPKYTIEDYLDWEGDWELWDGVAVSMSPSPSIKHQRISRRLVLQFDPQLKADECDDLCELFFECDWHVDQYTVVRPDGIIVCGDNDTDFIEDTPILIAEILSPSTRKKGLTAKRELYALHGVPFYLILDPEAKSATLLQLDSEGAYRDVAPEEPFELHPGCNLQLEVAPLFA